MWIVYGFYKFKQHVIGYREDYCNKCRVQVVAKYLHFFYCGHIFFIPLIPLGFHKLWVCPHCDTDPRLVGDVRSSIWLLGAIPFGLLGLLTLSLEFSPRKPSEDNGSSPASPDDHILLIAGLVFFLISAAFSWAYSNGKKIIAQRPAITPNLDVCPQCHTRLPADESPVVCPSCQVRIYTD
jgi:hypothetical protein